MNTTVEDHRVGFFTADLFVNIVTKWPHLIACEHIFLQHLGKDLSYYGQMQPFIWLGKPPPDMTSPPRAGFFCLCLLDWSLKENSFIWASTAFAFNRGRTVSERRKSRFGSVHFLRSYAVGTHTSPCTSPYTLWMDHPYPPSRTMTWTMMTRAGSPQPSRKYSR